MVSLYVNSCKENWLEKVIMLHLVKIGGKIMGSYIASRVEVNKAKSALEKELKSLPAGGQFRGASATLQNVLRILNQVWDTQGGRSAQAELEKYVSELDNYQELESSLEELRGASVSVSEAGEFREFVSKVTVEG